MDDIEQEMDCGSTSHFGSVAQERKEAILSAVDFLKSKRNLFYVESLGGGSFGDVLWMRDAKTKVNKAAKVIIDSNAVLLEQRIWPTLEHRNILPVDELLKMPDKTIIFLTPLKFKTLHQIVFDQRFQKNFNQNFKALVSWLRDILAGMEYMHARDYCHLDIKLRNTLVGQDGKACLCDFSCVNFNIYSVSVTDLGVHKLYRPPECFNEEDVDIISGIAVDIWSYGMMVIEATTDRYVHKNVNNWQSWTEGITPVLEFLFRGKNFIYLVQQAFPAYEFMKLEVWYLRHFISHFLQIQPLNRILAKDALRHPLFADIRNFVVVMTDIYSETEINSPDINKNENERTEDMELDPPQLIQEIRHKLRRNCCYLKRAAVKRKTLHQIIKKVVLKTKYRMQIMRKRKYRMFFQDNTLYKTSLSLCNLKRYTELRSESKDDWFRSKIRKISSNGTIS